jgi:hypothetical protein
LVDRVGLDVERGDWAVAKYRLLSRVFFSGGKDVMHENYSQENQLSGLYFEGGTSKIRGSYVIKSTAKCYLSSINYSE